MEGGRTGSYRYGTRVDQNSCHGVRDDELAKDMNTMAKAEERQEPEFGEGYLPHYFNGSVASVLERDVQEGGDAWLLCVHVLSLLRFCRSSFVLGMHKTYPGRLLA